MPLHIGLCVVFLAMCDEMLLIWAQIPLAAYSASRLPAYLPPQICCPIHLVGLTEGWCCSPWRGPAASMAAWNGTRGPEQGQSIWVCRKLNCHCLLLLLWQIVPRSGCDVVIRLWFGSYWVVLIGVGSALATYFINWPSRLYSCSASFTSNSALSPGFVAPNLPVVDFS